MTEFGWDTGIYATPYTSPAIGAYSQEEVQAQWILREYLLLSSTGIDRAAQYMLRNVTNNGKGQFETCGLVSEKNQWQPKPSWYYTYTMKNTLKGMYYTGEQASLNANVQIYTYENINRDIMVYVLWSPTSNGTIVNDYQLGMVNEPKTAKLVQLTNGLIDGTITGLKISRNSVKVNVSERPIFVVTTKNTSVSAANIKDAESEISIYPNPASEKLNIQITGSNSSEIVSVSIYNINGILVFNCNSVQATMRIDVSAFQSGLYFVETKTTNQVILKKFVKN
jgi:hypothetical protein